MALGNGIRAVGFDMDGTFMHTLVDYPKLERVVLDEFESLGVPVRDLPQGGYKFTLDDGRRWLAEHGMGDRIPGLNERIGARATEIEMENAALAEPFPGAVEALGLLKSRGYKVGILTRGGRDYARTVLGSARVYDEFDAVVARDDYPEEQAKPSAVAMEHLAERLGVECSEILYLGDGLVDYLTCANSGARFIGVETGRNTRSDWVGMVGEGVETVRSVADLIPMIRRIASTPPPC